MKLHYYASFHLVLLCAITLLLAAHTECSVKCQYPTDPLIHRSSFPPSFMFGAATSAFQYEGAAQKEGRAPCIWDTFAAEHPEKIADHNTADVTEDFYHRFKEDIAWAKELGFDFFRFSISWSRVLPSGKISGGVNQKGVDFYHSLIDELLLNGLQPFATLLHWDLPQALEDDYGGYLSSKLVDDFRDYADFCFQEFGDRVKYWITLNEPNTVSSAGYARGTNAPGRCSSYMGNCTEGNSATEPYLAAHNMILSHAAAVNLYRQKYKASQNGIIGITVTSRWFEPKYPTASCRVASFRAIDFQFGWIIHPLTYGDYPKSMRDFVGDRLPIFTEEQTKAINQSLDFVGISYYTARFAEEAPSTSSTMHLSYITDNHVNLTAEKEGVPIGVQAAPDWLYVYPEGIREITLYITRKYNNLPIIIAENGVGLPSNISSFPLVEALDDRLRVNYHHLHLHFLLEAIKNGADVRGYFAWSFLDTFEWDYGFSVRFGLNYIDYTNGLKRYPKCSALWFKRFFQVENSSSF